MSEGLFTELIARPFAGLDARLDACLKEVSQRQ
jgi:hypothetical protein